MDYTAGIFLFNGKHEILLVHPTNARMDTWSIPKGYVDDGETVLETAKREFFEELFPRPQSREDDPDFTVGLQT